MHFITITLIFNLSAWLWRNGFYDLLSSMAHIRGISEEVLATSVHVMKGLEPSSFPKSNVRLPKTSELIG